ncbi:hypothetical protein DFH09DRAFT_1465179 [Mycena vulgaris]|nr:hypothetical protein DFH09DRAFT_1465179 [Mycena vulgaris]
MYDTSPTWIMQIGRPYGMVMLWRDSEAHDEEEEVTYPSRSPPRPPQPLATSGRDQKTRLDHDATLHNEEPPEGAALQDGSERRGVREVGGEDEATMMSSCEGWATRRQKLGWNNIGGCSQRRGRAPLRRGRTGTKRAGLHVPGLAHASGSIRELNGVQLCECPSERRTDFKDHTRGDGQRAPLCDEQARGRTDDRSRATRVSRLSIVNVYRWLRKDVGPTACFMLGEGWTRPTLQSPLLAPHPRALPHAGACRPACREWHAYDGRQLIEEVIGRIRIPGQVLGLCYEFWALFVPRKL